MYLEDDRKRGQVLTGAKQLAFKDVEMVRVISTGFSIQRCTVEANRLVALAADVQREHDSRESESNEMPVDVAAIIDEGRKAKELLYLIEKPIN